MAAIGPFGGRRALGPERAHDLDCAVLAAEEDDLAAALLDTGRLDRSADGDHAREGVAHRPGAEEDIAAIAVIVPVLSSCSPPCMSTE